MRFIILVTALAFVLEAGAQSLPGRTLLWSDEFSQPDGSAPDSSKWAYDTGGNGWGNNEIQYYTNRTENSRIEGGNLVIEARAENFGGKQHTSARLLTKNKASWTFGRIEARIKVPRGQGIWPAFWMLGTDIDTVGWPVCGEIDIMENIGREPSIVHGTVHGPGYSGGDGITGDFTLPGAVLADDFHIFAIEWEENRIRWFIDGQQYHEVTPASLPGGAPWVFNTPQFLLLNVAVGGNWPGYPDGTTVFPQRMLVDYVRVYSALNSSATDVTADPSGNWLGYMNVSELPANGGAVLFGQPWNIPDLSAAFSGNILTLKPNSIADPATYWYVGGGAPGHPGNKIMGANMYVEKTGALSGKTVTFSGNVLSNTLTGAHSAVAFIKDFAPDYSSVNTITTPLVPGAFSISLATSPGAGRHVQYGFETMGPNVWSTDLGSFGEVQVTLPATDPYQTWIGGFAFPGSENPDLTELGDPDGDGLTNLEEFAFDGDPGSAVPSGKTRARVESIGGEQALTLTLPVLEGAVFAGSPAKSASVGNLVYVIEGADRLVAFDQGVSEIAPALATGLPALNPGWSYRSFRLDGVIGGTETRGPAGFLRARIAKNP